MTSGNNRKGFWVWVFNLLLVGGGPLLLFLMFVGWVFSEGYCFWEPSIDTRFATGFSEVRFRQVEVGMDSVQVVKILGTPLDEQVMDPADYISCPEIAPSHYTVIWHYSTDGKCDWNDFAWLGREIWFGPVKRVELVNSPVHYD